MLSLATRCISKSIRSGLTVWVLDGDFFYDASEFLEAQYLLASKSQDHGHFRIVGFLPCFLSVELLTGVIKRARYPHPFSEHQL